MDLPVDQGKAMREQAVLREEMQYHYRIGNKEVSDFYSISLCNWMDTWCITFLNIADIICYITSYAVCFTTYIILFSCTYPFIIQPT